MRDYLEETQKRVAFIRELLQKSGASGIVYGNSGGKDCTLVGILCKLACENTLGVMMPCGTRQNYGSDLEDAKRAAAQYGIENVTVDLTETRQQLCGEIEKILPLNRAASTNIAPRLRMSVLYAVAAAKNCLVAGTGNRSERYMGYFTKWGDGACDFNVIADLTVTEVYEFLRYFDAPESILTKKPSGGLFDGQTDESEMGVSYAAIDALILNGEAGEAERRIIERYHAASAHKRSGPILYGQ